MKILVPVKRVIEANTKVRVKPDQSGVELNNVKMDMNPFCEIAVEQAIRLVETKKATEVVLVSVGTTQAQETIRKGLAMGADRGIHIASEHETENLLVAKLLVKVIEKEKPGLVLLGKQAIDGDANQTGQMLSALLGWAGATFVSKLELKGDKATMTREVDGGLEIVEVAMPAIVTVDLRLNEPRYTTLPNIMKAKKKPIETLTPDQLGVKMSPRLKTLKVIEPKARGGGVKVKTIGELVKKLHEEAKVI
ncbi:MAG: electron transfer flavoprotein subunit beta/FixA family protein [Alphaproteobacteria bacterium]|nr:electron transfer flavoprotein subunit beta/FixA family protein [Alphaproteobacteria bacterium]